MAWAIWSGSNSGSCVGIIMSPVYTRPGVASSTSSHSARPQVDYDLSFGSHPRSPSRYFGCLTFEMSTQLAQELARPAAIAHDAAAPRG